MVFGLSTIVAALSFLSLPSFSSWIKTYNKSYSNYSEYNDRHILYTSNLLKISKHNSDNHT